MLNLLTSNTSTNTATTCSSASNSTSTLAAQQLLSQLAVATPSSSSSVNQQSSTVSTTSAIGTCPSTPITKPLGINTNLTNIQNNTQNANMLFQNNAQQQMSPNSALKAKLGIQTSSSSNYPLNSLQNQLNTFQKQPTGNTAATNASSSTNLLAAAAATLIQSLPNATASNLNLYSNNHNHHHNHQASVGLNNHMHQNHPFAQMSPSTSSAAAAAAAAASGSSSSSSTCNLNNTLFVGNLHASLQEIDLIQVFRPFGRIVECCKKWLHFGFVKFTTEEEACHAYVTLNGFRLKGRPMRLEFQNRSKKAKIKAILAQAAAVHGVAAAGLMNLNGSAADFNLLSMGSNAQNAQTLAVAASFNSLLTAAATASSNASSSTLDERHLLQQQFQNSSSNSNSSYMLNQHNNQHHQSQYFHQQQQQQMSSNKQDQLLNSLFSSEQLLKFASSENNNNQQQQQQQQHQSSVFQLQIPELNFDLISENQSIQQQQQQNLYDFTELDLKLQVDDLHLQNHSQNFNFLDVNYSTSSAVSSSSSSSHHNQKASDDNIVMSLIKNTISPVESPKHDISSSLSTDSGCRSNSFLNDEDSAICSLAQTTTITTMNTSRQQMNAQKKGTNGSSTSSTSGSDSNKMMTKMEDFSEHLEFTCSNSSPLKSSALDNQMQQNNTQKQAKVVNLEEEDEEDEHDGDVDDCSSDCDTSDDASDIPEEQEVEDDHDDEEEQNVQNSSIDSLNDLDLDEITNELHNLSCLTEQQQQKPEVRMYEALIKHSQVMDKDGCVKRMQLNPGCVYTSVNESQSLFIEPNDVLKKLEVDEVEEYNLFSPSRKQSQNLHDFVDHLLSSMRNQFYLGSN